MRFVVIELHFQYGSLIGWFKFELLRHANALVYFQLLSNAFDVYWSDQINIIILYVIIIIIIMVITRELVHWNNIATQRFAFRVYQYCLHVTKRIT